MKKVSLWKTAAALSLVLLSAACGPEEIPATISGLPDGDVTFEWNSTESQTITVEANYDWTFEENDKDNIIEVSRPEGTNDLVITPNRNYSIDVLSATINITAGSGSAAATQTITVSQGANTKTYLTFLDSDMTGDNPIIQFPSEIGGEPAVREIRMLTNNILSIEISANQEVIVPEEPETPEEGEEGETDEQTKSSSVTKVQLPDDYGWMSYEISEEETDEGTVSVLTLTSQINQDTEKNLTVAIEIVSGSEEINNEIVTKRVGLVSLSSEPTITTNPDPETGLVFEYNSTEPQTFSLITNVEHWVMDEEWGSESGNEAWPEFPTIEKVGEENGVVTYSVTVPAYYLTTDRAANIGFQQTDENGNRISPEEGGAINIFRVTQKGAPQASITLNENQVIFNNDETEKLVELTVSIPERVAVSCSDTEGNEAGWLSAEYDETAGALVISVKEVPEDEANNGIVTVTVGEGANTAAAKLQVTQIAKTPSIMVKPESVILNSNGDAVDVEVVTNVDSWDIVPESGDTDVITASKKDEKTISVSASSLTAGDRNATFTIKAGEVSATLNVVQRVKMNIGDPFVVNGKTVGIVYEVDAEGMHGKAFSLTVKNICDMYFFKGSNDEWVELPDGNWTMIPGVTMEDSYTPRNTTNGLTNSQTMKTAPDWENHFQMLKWVEDLGKEQGVEWYIPAIEELKAVVEYMSNAKFITTTDEFGTTTTKLDDSDPAKIETAWDNIRNLYKEYSLENNTEQYVVFQATNEDNSEYVDCLHPAIYDEDTWELVQPGDDKAYRWISSTVVKPEGMRDYMSYTVHTKNYATDPYAAVYDWHVPAIFKDAGWGDDFDQYGCSIHPICQF